MSTRVCRREGTEADYEENSGPQERETPADVCLASPLHREISFALDGGLTSGDCRPSLVKPRTCDLLDWERKNDGDGY